MIQESLPLATSVYGESVLDLALSCETRGPRAFSDIELIALLFKLDQHAARQWLRRMGSLSALVNNSPSAQAIIEFSRRYIEEDIRRGDALVDVSSVRDYLVMCLRGHLYEVFACLFLDNKHRVIAYEELFKGTIDSCSVHPREVARRVIKHNAAAVIFAHNHPSGVAEPSQADHRITSRLKESLGLLDCRVLDHFIVGDDVVSFAERGYL